MAFVYNLEDTWSNASTTFTAIKMDVTDTASAAASELIALQVGGTDKFTVRKDGFTDINGNLRLSASSAAIELNTGGPQVYVPAANTFAIATGGGIGSPVERVRIDSSGNVGVNTTSITNSAGFKRLAINDTSGGILEQQVGGTATGRLITSAASVSLDAITSIPLTFKTAATERMRIDSSGNVGIGTTSQIDYPLNLKADSNGKCLSFIETGAGTESWQLGVDTSGNFNFYDSTSNTPSITIQDTTGNVGIGTDSPATITSGITALSISDTGGKTTGDKIGELNFVTNDGSFTGTFSDGIGAAINAVSTSATGAAYALTFTTATTTGSNRAERLRIDETGNVGIGVSSPNRKLSVNSGTTDVVAQFESSDSGAYIALKDDSTSSATAVMVGAVGDDMRFDAGDVERMRIDSSGNVGINDSTPSYTLDVNGQIATRDAYLLAANSSGTPSAGAFISRPASNTLALGTASAERARIDSNGKLLLATTSTFDNVSFLKAQFLGGLATKIAGTGTTSQVSFFNDNGRVGYIGTSGTTTSYNTSSDARLKTNIANADDAAAVIDGIQVRKFDWKDNGEHQRYGMVAQELVEVAPEAVTGEPDSDEMMAVDYSKLVPMLVKEVQSLRKRVAELETSATTITFEGSE